MDEVEKKEIKIREIRVLLYEYLYRLLSEKNTSSEMAATIIELAKYLAI